MPNVPPIPLTLESEAFKFNLKGTEDWNNTYNRIARNPVTYYIEIVKQPAGFEVPEASKIEEPVDPEPEPGSGGDLARRNLLRRPSDGLRRFADPRVRQPGGQELGVGRFDLEGIRSWQ